MHCLSLGMNASPHLAVVDDHPQIREMLTRYLGAHGYRVSEAANGAEFRRLLERSSFDLVILDVMMPGEDGIAICRDLRMSSQLPVIFLTAVAEDADRILGLEIGADDYLTKPFNPRELLARIRSVLRRANSLPLQRVLPQTGSLRIGELTVDMERREVTAADGVAAPLSTAEFRLLCVFIAHPGMVLTRDELLDLTQGRAAEAWDRSIDNQVSRLRRKIEADPRNPLLIATHWGGGYSFTGKVEPV
jgi:two-component system OmpR family response regulator